MNPAYHLRPVNDISPSPSPTASTTSPAENSPHFKPPIGHSPPSANGRLRRPLSPSSLRDVDLSQAPDMAHRKYPTPPTGHDLMAMFPPAPPDNFPEMRPGPTSGFFQRQERAFFAQAGKEIVRVRVEVDFPHGAEPEPTPAKPHRTPASATSTSSRPWMNGGPPSPGSSAPVLYPHPTTRPPPRGVVSPAAPFHPSTTSPISTTQTPTLQQPSPLGTNLLRTPPQDAMGPLSAKPEYQSEEYDPDEAWRRPMPYNERRRAGKHTRRVIVRT